MEHKNIETLDNIEFRSEEVQEVLSEVPHWMIRWGSLVCLSIIILLLILSYVVRYPDVIQAETIVTTPTPPQKEFARTSGKIDSIYIKDLDNVRENDVLAIIENNAIAEDVYFLKSILDTIELRDNTLEFPIEEIPPLLFLGDMEESFATFQNNYYQLALNIELKPFQNDEMANRISLSELNRRLQNLRAQLKLNESEMEFKKNELDRNKSLFEKGVISEQEFENIQLEVLTAERNLKSLIVSISQTREGISGARKSSKATEFSRAKGEIQLLKNTIQSFNQLKKAIKDWEYTYVLKSEIEGKVSFLNVWNENQTVSEGDLVFTIIPKVDSDFIAKVRAPLRNSGKIKIGQSVNIKLENYPETEFGMIRGKVENISLAASKDGFYVVDVSLPKELVTSYGRKITFKQEMKGSAEIITDDLRLLERFFYQFKELFDQ